MPASEFEVDTEHSMVKKRHAVEEVAFAHDRPLGLEVLRLKDLMARASERDLTRPQRPVFHHLFLFLAGKGTHTVDFVRSPVRRGTVLHLVPGQVQQFGAQAGLDAWLVVFQPEFVRAALTPLAPTRLTHRLPTVLALFESLAREVDAFDGSPRGRAFLQSLVESTALSLARDAGDELDAPLLRQFRQALETHFRKTHEVSAYAAVLRCSSRTLTRRCEEWTGKSAKVLIDERVVLEARRELAHGQARVAELSAALGFAEPTQFVKFFRRLTGTTPLAFRQAFARRRGAVR